MQFDIPAASVQELWPTCTRECGIFIEDAQVIVLNEQQVLWTDGACANNQDQRFRRAGSGIFYGAGHHMNASMILPGYVQSNQRAELLAVVVACLCGPWPLDTPIQSESGQHCCVGLVLRT